jgi:hypothetical protein
LRFEREAEGEVTESRSRDNREAVLNLDCRGEGSTALVGESTGLLMVDGRDGCRGDDVTSARSSLTPFEAGVNCTCQCCR